MEQRSFTDFLDAYGEAHRPIFCYTQGEDFGEWQKRFRDKVLEFLGPVLDRVEPYARAVETTREADYTRHLLDIRVNEFSTLPAYLLIPHGLPKSEKRPGLLVSHGHVPYGIDTMCGVAGMEESDNALRAYGLFAAQSGYIVIVPAWWRWRGRDGHLGMVDQRDKCDTIQMAASMYGLSVLSLHIQDAQAALDVLISRPEVDSERIGCLGNSYGRRTAMWFTIVDERIKVCVAAGCMNTFRERSLKLLSCGIQYPHGLLRYGDVPELFSLIAPRPLQLQAGEGDSLITPSDRDMIERRVRQAYRCVRAEHRFSYELHQEGHRLLWEPAEAFLDKHLSVVRCNTESGVSADADKLRG